MPTSTLSHGRTTTPRRALALVGALAAVHFFANPAHAQDGKQTPESSRSKAPADKSAEVEVSRFCANVAPSLAEARIAWQTKRLAELDAQVQQRLADLEKAQASVQEWVAKRDAMLKAASDDLVAIYSKMQPESAAVQLSAMDDRTAAAILGKLKPAAAGAILNEMEAERASKLASLLSGASMGGEKRS
jgi:flagellar motility protein MotE (MotC chaperone)